jgi:hypothetical protein
MEAMMRDATEMLVRIVMAQGLTTEAAQGLVADALSQTRERTLDEAIAACAKVREETPEDAYAADYRDLQRVRPGEQIAPTTGRVVKYARAKAGAFLCERALREMKADR